MNIVDSSGWLEYFAGGENASQYIPPLSDQNLLVVPVIVIFEVFKVILREAGEDAALQAASAMQRGILVELTTQRAMSAAALSLKYSLPMADSIILAAAREYKAVVWTQDADFKDLDNVKYFPKK